MRRKKHSLWYWMTHSPDHNFTLTKLKAIAGCFLGLGFAVAAVIAETHYKVVFSQGLFSFVIFLVLILMGIYQASKLINKRPNHKDAVPKDQE